MNQALFAGAALITALMLYFLTYFETLLFSLSQSNIQQLSESESNDEKWIDKLLKETNKFEIFFIVSRALLLGLFIILIHYFLESFHLNFPMTYILDIVIFWVFMILIFHMLPMYLAMRKCELTTFSIAIGKMLYYLFFPLTVIWKAALTPLLNRQGAKSLESLAFERELTLLLPNEESTLDLEPVEKQMIKHIIEFGDTNVREIMSPRIDMVCIKEDAKISEIVDVIREVGHSRLPIYRERIDNIIGILYVKDLLIAMSTKGNDVNLVEIARTPYFVPEAKVVSDLLAEFRNRKIHMAVVVDEYGGVAGIVTMEDILEEIVGEIQDEYDTEEAPIVKLSEFAFIATGKTTIDEINEFTGLDLPTEEDFDSIGGMVFHKLGEVPEQKAKFFLEDQNVFIIVEEIEGHRIEKVKIVIKEDNKDSDND